MPPAFQANPVHQLGADGEGPETQACRPCRQNDLRLIKPSAGTGPGNAANSGLVMVPKITSMLLSLYVGSGC